MRVCARVHVCVIVNGELDKAEVSVLRERQAYDFN